MAEQNQGKLHRLEHLLPEGLLVDAAWLTDHGYSTSLRSQYVTAGWLQQPARQVYQRRRGSTEWKQAVISLQTLLGQNLVVGGRTSLELQGFAHYLPQHDEEVHLYGPKRPPTWLQKLKVGVRFSYHNSARLFRHTVRFPQLNPESFDATSIPDDFVALPWGQWGWNLILSSPERAIFELLDELPRHESFHTADKLFEGLSTLRPRRLQRLLANCRSVKAKRLFFFFADRHRHAWLARLDKNTVDLGKGKRTLVSGGGLNPTYQITVPRDFDAV